MIIHKNDSVITVDLGKDYDDRIYVDDSAVGLGYKVAKDVILELKEAVDRVLPETYYLHNVDMSQIIKGDVVRVITSTSDLQFKVSTVVLRDDTGNPKLSYVDLTDMDENTFYFDYDDSLSSSFHIVHRNIPVPEDGTYIWVNHNLGYVNNGSVKFISGDIVMVDNLQEGLWRKASVQ